MRSLQRGITRPVRRWLRWWSPANHPTGSPAQRRPPPRHSPPPSPPVVDAFSPSSVSTGRSVERCPRSDSEARVVVVGVTRPPPHALGSRRALPSLSLGRNADEVSVCTVSARLSSWTYQQLPICTAVALVVVLPLRDASRPRNSKVEPRGNARRAYDSFDKK